MKAIRIDELDKIQEGMSLPLKVDASIAHQDGTNVSLESNIETSDLANTVRNIKDRHDPKTVLLVIKTRAGNSWTKAKEVLVDCNESGLPDFLGDEKEMLEEAVTAITRTDNNKDKMEEQVGKWFVAQVMTDREAYKKRVEELQTENMDLKRQLNERSLEIKQLELAAKFTEKEHEFTIKKKEEEGSGLSGITETLSTNPQLANVAAMAVARLMGIDPLSVLAPAQQQVGGVVDEDSAPMRIARIAEQLPADTQYKLFVFAQLCAQQPTIIQQVLEQFKTN